MCDELQREAVYLAPSPPEIKLTPTHEEASQAFPCLPHLVHKLWDNLLRAFSHIFHDPSALFPGAVPVQSLCDIRAFFFLSRSNCHQARCAVFDKKPLPVRIKKHPSIEKGVGRRGPSRLLDLGLGKNERALMEERLKSLIMGAPVT